MTYCQVQCLLSSLISTVSKQPGIDFPCTLLHPGWQWFELAVKTFDVDGSVHTNLMWCHTRSLLNGMQIPQSCHSSWAHVRLGSFVNAIKQARAERKWVAPYFPTNTSSETDQAVRCFVSLRIWLISSPGRVHSTYRGGRELLSCHSTYWWCRRTCSFCSSQIIICINSSLWLVAAYASFVRSMCSLSMFSMLKLSRVP